MDLQRLTRIIEAALEGKYTSESRGVTVRAIVHDTYEKISHLHTEQDVLAGAEPTTDLRTDISNQVRAYVLIDLIWPNTPPEDRILERIHAATCGLALADVTYRVSVSVEDFHDEIPTPVADIERRLVELNASVAGAGGLRCRSALQQASYLAELFARIIRVHPFPDGNGRTARLAIQHCLRLWERDCLVVPKVRNDTEWRIALTKAITGDYDSLAHVFHARMMDTTG